MPKVQIEKPLQLENPNRHWSKQKVYHNYYKRNKRFSEYVNVNVDFLDSAAEKLIDYHEYIALFFVKFSAGSERYLSRAYIINYLLHAFRKAKLTSDEEDSKIVSLYGDYLDARTIRKNAKLYDKIVRSNLEEMHDVPEHVKIVLKYPGNIMKNKTI